MFDILQVGSRDRMGSRTFLKIKALLSTHDSRSGHSLTLKFYKVTQKACATIHGSTRYLVMCKVYTGYHGTSEIEHGLCTCTVDNSLAKTRGLSLRTGTQTMLYLTSR